MLIFCLRIFSVFEILSSVQLPCPGIPATHTQRLSQRHTGFNTFASTSYVIVITIWWFRLLVVFVKSPSLLCRPSVTVVKTAEICPNIHRLYVCAVTRVGSRAANPRRIKWYTCARSLLTDGRREPRKKNPGPFNCPVSGRSVCDYLTTDWNATARDNNCRRGYN